MSLRTFWQAYRAKQARRFLQGHPQLALDCLRRDPSVAAQAMQHFFAMQGAAGEPSRQTLSYPVLSTGTVGGRQAGVQTLAKPIPWQIRSFSEMPVARRAINALTDPVIELPFTVQLRRPLTRDLHEAPPQPTAEQQARITAATLMFERPNEIHSGREFLETILEDLIVAGAGPFEVGANTSDTRPLFCWPVDALSLRINAAWTPQRGGARYAQGRSGLFGTSPVTNEVLLQDEDLCYPKLNSRAHTPFGLGYLEIAFETINAFLGAFGFAARRASNSVPPFLIFLGENVTVDQVRMWQAYWENEIEGMGKVPILGGGRQPTIGNLTGTGTDPLWLAWQEWLVRVVAMAFGLSPQRLGLERDVNRSTSETQNANDWGTIAPVASVLSDAFTHWILRQRLGWIDLEFVWKVRTADELKQAEILAIQFEMNAATVDEIREVYERPPLADGLGSMTKVQFETAIKTLAASQLQQEQSEQQLTLQKEKPVVLPGQRADEHAAFACVTPFDDVEHLSPSEEAFVRSLMRQARRGKNGQAWSV